MQKSLKLFARKFSCTWITHRATKYSNILQNYSPIGYKQFLKFPDQLVVRSMYSNSSKFRFLLKFTKNGQIDDVIKWSWRHQKKIKHSLLHPPIDDLLDMGSEDGLSIYLFEIKKLPIGTFTAVEAWKKRHFQTQLFWWMSNFENI